MSVVPVSTTNCSGFCIGSGQMEKFLRIAPHSLALVLSRVCGDEEEISMHTEKLQHHMGYEIFANFKSANMQQFWNKRVTDAISEIFFLGWIDEHVLLIQGKEDHLEVLRNGWTRRALKPPAGFDIKCIGTTYLTIMVYRPRPISPVYSRALSLSSN